MEGGGMVTSINADVSDSTVNESMQQRKALDEEDEFLGLDQFNQDEKTK